jgi:tRNA (guanine37-N1)-methyltransferase
MNLPDSAITFLDTFRGVLSPANLGSRDVSSVYGDEGDDGMPMIHCHCFTKETDPDKAAIDIRTVCIASTFTPLSNR